MKILITGSHGYIGSYLYSKLDALGYNLVGIDKHKDAHQTIDATEDIFEKFLLESKPEIIIHTAAAKDLKYCEDNRIQAWISNVKPAVHILNFLKQSPSTKVIYISSDVIFDGEKGNYKVSDRPNPINWYGETKLQNELIFQMVDNTTILRTALVYGDLTGDYKKILISELGNEILLNQSLLPHYVYNRLYNNMPVKLPNNIISSPTHLETIFQGIVNVIQNDIRGVYHLAGSEIISRYDFAVKIARYHNLDEKLVSKDEGAILPFRPKNIGLDINDSYKKLCLNVEDWRIDQTLKSIHWELV